MKNIVHNERSWAIDLISEINVVLNTMKLKIQKAGGESTIRNKDASSGNGRKIMFPDVLLYGDKGKSNIIQGWELKLPDISITDETFIQDAQYKAEQLGLNSTVIWNFNSVVLYKKNNQNEWIKLRQWNDLNHITDRSKVKTYEEDWKKFLKSLLIQLNDFLTEGILHTTPVDLVVSENILAELINNNKNQVAIILKQKVITDRTIEAKLTSWWKAHEYEFHKDERDMFIAYSKNILTDWILKFTFSHLIKRYCTPAKKVESITVNTTPHEANKIFNKIGIESKFKNIFDEVDYNMYISDDFWHDLVSYNAFLEELDMDNFDQKILQRMLENTVDGIKREIIGQYTTPSTLAELLVKSTVKDTSRHTLDPCSGSGTIAKEALLLKKKHNPTSAYETFWASDKFNLPLQITSIAATDFSSFNSQVKLFQSNVFDLIKDKRINYLSSETGKVISDTIPSFESIVSNLPFVPFEIISKDDKLHAENIRVKIKQLIGIEINQRADLYIYIVAHLWYVLNTGGRLGIIVSNSWLGTKSGKDFFELLRELYHIEYILISGNKKWFSNADVVTTMIILTKKEVEDATKNIRFGILNCSLEELNIENRLEEVSNHILANTYIKKEILNTSSLDQATIDELLNFNISRNALFHNIDWLLEFKEDLLPLNKVFKVNRGMRRGWDPMFYPESNHQIEAEYIQRVLKNSRSIDNLVATTDSDAFCCFDSISDLVLNKKTGALNWIKKFEDQTNKTGIPLPKVLQKSAAKGQYWYQMDSSSRAELVTTLNPDKRLFYSKLDQEAFINQRLIGLSRLSNKTDLDLTHALLNSLLGSFFVEAVGFGRGLGALDINKDNLSSTYILNPDRISPEQKADIIAKFQVLQNRSLLPFLNEFKKTDRIEFEMSVLSAFNKSHLYQDILESIISMQRVRLTVLES
ncbi:N-6 DNA methylase [Paenibacillus sp. An7]|uniref:N-6 DNA methylase n=1 Tax=Paenibacillus sp. An7 TaxID=2689577 RepID=UPI00135B32B5|nr:N-6 DNA methylase [Paenibacillus sp. An7]